jgi:pyruvate kinase
MNSEIHNSASHRRRTKIIATLGPATDEPEVLEGMIRAGVDVFRLNVSHGDAVDHEKRAGLVRKAARKLRWQVALLVDLQGPNISPWTPVIHR